MGKDLKLITSLPSDKYFSWQVINWLNSAREHNLSDKCEILIYKTWDKKVWDKSWDQVERLFPEAKFFYYADEGLGDRVTQYIPVLRPYTLWKHWRAYPQMVNSTIFYHDSDILLTGDIDFSLFKEDVCYVSDARSYTNATYFEGKERDVLPEKLEEYKESTILENVTSLCGIKWDVVKANNENSGGAQYILNGIEANFWEEMIENCLSVYNYLGMVNKYFFPNEDKGFQRWCADMFVMLWQMWGRGIKTEVHKELDFAWSTDRREKLENVKIMHNAGIGGVTHKIIYNKQEVEVPVFWKGKYHNNITTPFKDTGYLNKILVNEATKSICNHYYTQKLMECKNKYNL